MVYILNPDSQRQALRPSVLRRLTHVLDLHVVQGAGPAVDFNHEEAKWSQDAAGGPVLRRGAGLKVWPPQPAPLCGRGVRGRGLGTLRRLTGGPAPEEASLKNTPCPQRPAQSVETRSSFAFTWRINHGNRHNYWLTNLTTGVLRFGAASAWGSRGPAGAPVATRLGPPDLPTRV